MAVKLKKRVHQAAQYGSVESVDLNDARNYAKAKNAKNIFEQTAYSIKARNENRKSPFKSTMSQRLAYIEKTRFKDFDKAYQQMQFQKNSKLYQDYMRRMNTLFSCDFRRDLSAKLHQTDADGKRVNTDAMTYKLGFYAGLLISSKGARQHVASLFKDQDWPPQSSKHKFINALRGRDKTGREPFTPETAGMCLVALTEKTYQNMMDNPAKSGDYLKDYKNLRDSLYEMAGQDGCNKKDIDHQFRDITCEIVKEDPTRLYEFSGLSTGDIKLQNNGQFAGLDKNGKMQELENGIFRPQVPLTKETYQESLAHEFSKYSDDIAFTPDDGNSDKQVKQYYDYQNRLDKLAKAQGISAQDISSFRSASYTVPASGVFNAIAKKAVDDYGEDNGSKLVDIATRFSQKSMMADLTTNDAKRRMYNYATDNAISGVTPFQSMNVFNQMHEAAAKVLKHTPLNTKRVYKAFDLGNQYQRNKFNCEPQNVNEEAINEVWMKDMVEQASAQNPRFRNIDETKTQKAKLDLWHASGQGHKAAQEAADKINIEIDKKPKSKYSKKYQPRKINAEKLSGNKFMNLLDELNDEYGIQGVSLALDVYKKASGIDKRDNRGQYVDIGDKKINKVNKAIKNFIKYDKYDTVKTCVDAYEKSLSDNPILSSYIENSRQNKYQNGYNKSQEKTNQGPSVNTNRDQKGSQRAYKHTPAPGPEIAIPELDIEKLNPNLARNMEQNSDSKEDSL